MIHIKVDEREPFEKAMRRFSSACLKAGVIQGYKRKMYFEKPSRRKYLKRKRQAFEAKIQ